MDENGMNHADNRDIPAEYHARLVREAWLRAAVWGAAVGLLIGALIVTVLLYVCRFKPDEKQTARHHDALGLKERAVTMLTVQGSDPCITAMQRADTAARSLSNVRLVGTL